MKYAHKQHKHNWTGLLLIFLVFKWLENTLKTGEEIIIIICLAKLCKYTDRQKSWSPRSMDNFVNNFNNFQPSLFRTFIIMRIAFQSNCLAVINACAMEPDTFSIDFFFFCVHLPLKLLEIKSEDKKLYILKAVIPVYEMITSLYFLLRT